MVGNVSMKELDKRGEDKYTDTDIWHIDRCVCLPGASGIFTGIIID